MKYRREWKLDNAKNVLVAGVALLFVAAGILHLSAAADHRHLPFMMAGFVVVALVQIGTGALLFLRGPSRGLLLLGLLLMVGSVGIWLWSRTLGLPFLPGGHMEPIGFKDGVTVLFELAAVPGLLAIGSPALGAVSLPSAQLGRQALTGLAGGIILMFVPALVLGGGGHHSMDQMAAMSGHHDDGSGHHDAAAGGHHETGSGGHHDAASGDHHAGADGEGQVLGAPHHGDSGHDDHGADAGGAAPGEHAGGHHATAARHSGDHGEMDHADMDHGDMNHGGDQGAMDHQGDHGDMDHSGDHGDMNHGGEHGDMNHEGHGGGEDDGHGGHGAGDDGGHGEHGAGDDDRSEPPVPGVATARATYIEPKPAGTRETIKLQYGPYAVPPGGDANQVNLEFFGSEGFITAAKPDVRYADGTTLGHEDRLHVHHAHLFRQDVASGDDQADTRQGLEWVFGTGGETTSGSFERISNTGSDGRDQWGIGLKREPMLMVWMPMNMSEETQTVFMEFEFEFVHGTAESIKKATGRSYHPLSPVMYGSTFNVPKTGGIYDWPLDVKGREGDAFTDSKLDPESFGTSEPTQKTNVVPGVGEIWTAPEDGVLVGSAGHQHAGGRGVVVSNLGSEQRPCAEDGDRYPGTTVLNSKTYYPEGIWPAHPLMGVSQPGWRVYVEKGDRIAINGVYDTRTYAWPDQMSILGFYWDENASGSDSQRCGARLADEPGATQAEVVASLPSQDAARGDDGDGLFHTGPQPCVADGCNDYDAPPAPRGPQTTEVVIEDFTFTPGDLRRKSAVSGSTGSSYGGAPVVARGDKLRFVNADYTGNAGTRHAIASCDGPCNGPDVMSYPNTDGKYYSGPLGYSPLAESASASNKAAPAWELDTSTLEPGYHTYYCWSHPWMRGAFYVEEMSDVRDGSARSGAVAPAPSPMLAPVPTVPDLVEDGPDRPVPDSGSGLPEPIQQEGGLWQGLP